MANLVEKYKKLPKGVKASSWLLISSILQKGITFMTTPVFTRMMTSEQYGAYSVFLSWQEILMIFATLNLNYQVFNNGMIKYKNDKDGYTTSMVGLALVSSIVTFLCISILFDIFNRYSGVDYLSFILMSVNMFMIVVSGLWIVRNRFDYNYRLATILTIIFTILNPILGIFLVNSSDDKVLFRVISVTITSALFGGVCLALLLKKSRRLFYLKYWKYALKIDLPLVPHYISMVILHSSDRIMISNITNQVSVAYYSISYSVAIVMQIVLNSLNASFIPWVYQKMQVGEYGKIKKYNTRLLVFVAAVSSIPMFFAPEAVEILGGHDYIDAASIIPLLSSSVFMVYLYSLFIIIEMYYEKSIYTTIGSISAALLNIILNAIAIPAFGYKAAAATTLVSYIALALFHYIIYKRILKKNKIKEAIFDVRSMVIISIAIILLSLVVGLIYDSAIVRFAIVGVAAVIAILQRDSLAKLLKKNNTRGLKS